MTALELFGELEWLCCETPDREPSIFERWTCPWCGSVWEGVEHFPNDIPHWWHVSGFRASDGDGHVIHLGTWD